jgi:hypothetical protein
MRVNERKRDNENEGKRRLLIGMKRVKKWVKAEMKLLLQE